MDIIIISLLLSGCRKGTRYTGGNWTLDVTFDKGGQDLTGLDINSSQEFVIEEDIIN